MADEYLTAALYGIKRFNEWSGKKVKELMGAEKLIELLNEYGEEKYEKEIKSSSYYWGIRNGKLECSVGGTDHDLYDDEIAMVIKSKEFGFIKWLVENEKLKWTDKMEMRKIMLGMPEKQDYYIMMLAVTPQPIEFLVSILK